MSAFKMPVRSTDWISENEKFALLALDLSLSVNFKELNYSNILFRRDFGINIPKEWKKWLGSIETDDILNCNFFIITKLTSKNVQIFDEEYEILNNIIMSLFYGILLIKPFHTNIKTTIISGYKNYNTIDIIKKQDVDLLCQNRILYIVELNNQDIERALYVAENIRKVMSNVKFGKFKRLRDILLNYRLARQKKNHLDRIHQFCRCVEAVIVTEQGRSRDRFKSRTVLFIGPYYHDIMGKIYDVRSCREHMNEIMYIDKFDRSTALNIIRYEAIIENIARNTIYNIFSKPILWEQFETTDSIKQFWKLNETEMRSIWGEPYNPMSVLDKFDESHYSNSNLMAQ